jgi:hypothetical protein
MTRKTMSWAVAGLFVCLMVSGAWAQSKDVGCGFMENLRPAAKGAHLQFVSLQEDSASIVGLWKFSFVAEGNAEIPDGAVIDSGYVTWHADGTELMNSGRAPMTGSFCMGVWKKVGRTYKLNHFALSWDPSGTSLVGPANIRERLRVDPDNNSYSGTFTLDQYDTSGNVLVHIQGNVTGERITAD